MERITKTLSLEKWIADSVDKIAHQEKRSFTKQVETMLESALIREKDLDAIKCDSTQVDPALSKK